MARGASSSSSAAALAPGFRFHPTDEELVSYYLRRKLYNKPFRFEAISVVDIYKFEPWDLPDLSLLKSRDLEWYFFCILDKKYGNGRKTNRATEQGYWKTTGKDRAIQWNSRAVGMKKTLVFHIGRAPKGERTNWVMHEYRMVDEELGKEGIAQDAFVLCRIFQKSGPGPKNGEMYGAPFIEEEWDEDVLVPKKESSDDNEQKMSSCGSASANQRRRLNDPEWKYKQKSTAEFRSRLESDQWRDVGQVDEVGSVPRDSLGVMIGGSRKKQRQKGPMDFYCRLSPSDVVAEKGKKVQTTIENRYKKEERNHTISYVVRWLYQAGIAFNTVKLKSFKLMIEAIGQFGPGFEPPTYYELREPLLKQEVNNTKKVLETYKMAWKKYGCTIMYDGWTDQRGKSLTNFLVNCPEGTMFLKSIDISDSVHDKEFLFKLLDDVVEEIGEENVVQVVTDNAAAYVAAGDLLMDKRRKLFWAPCAANSIDLMLSDIGKLPSTSAILTKGRAITTFIYKYTFLLNMMRRKIRGKDLIRPAITRFSTAFLTLQSIYTHKNALRALFVSNTYSQSKYAKKPEGLRAFSIVMSATFWKGVANSLKAAHPLVKVLRIINSEEKPPMGNIYQAMVQAREQIKATFNDNEKDYKPILDIIDRRWYMQLNYPLHLAAYFLNPSLYYAAREVDENSLARFQEGFYECLERMVPDHVLQDQISIQVLDYKNARGVFGRDIAIRQRTTIQPIEWWDAYGIKTPDLKTLAFRILGLTCRASSCECNWSTFEHIHTKKRNRLEQKRLNDLVFVQYNQRLREKFLERQEQPDAYDPISLDELDSTCEWLVKQLEDKVAFEGDDLTMLDVDPTLKASQVKGSQRPRRQSKTVSPAGTSKRARQQEIEEEIDSEETGEDEVYMEGDDDDDDDDGDDALGNWREDENIDFRLEDFC